MMCHTVPRGAPRTLRVSYILELAGRRIKNPGGEDDQRIANPHTLTLKICTPVTKSSFRDRWAQGHRHMCVQV